MASAFSQPPAIETLHLRKEYGPKIAVANLTLRVEQGEVFGFLGPNGAGKTTAIKMLLGLSAPTQGAASLLGKPIADHRARRRVGFMPEHFRFPDWLTATELLALHGRLLRMELASLSRQIPALLDQVGLAASADSRLRTFSKGMLQRLGLAQALLNEPLLVFLDEPTSGLDPLGRRLVRDVVKTLRGRGTTVFLNSHLLSEVEVTCDRVAFIKDGAVVKSAPLGELERGSTALSVRAEGVTPELLAGLGRWASDVRQEGDRLVMAVADGDAVPDIVAWLVEGGARLHSVTPQRQSLEDLFFEIVGSEGGAG